MSALTLSSVSLSPCLSRALYCCPGPSRAADLCLCSIFSRGSFLQHAAGVFINSGERASHYKTLRGSQALVRKQRGAGLTSDCSHTTHIQASLKGALEGSGVMSADDVCADGLSGKTFFLDAFAQRQWDEPNYSGTRIDHGKADFVRTVEEMYKDGAKMHKGYADFCKHLFIPNFVGARAGHLRIDATNAHLLASGYKARSASELPVLSRWFPADKVTGQATEMLDIILYSREQLLHEQKATASRKGITDKDGPRLPDAPWGIISIKAQDEDFELPMSPITIMRNALGAEEGGSGVPLDREAYLASVHYWDHHAMIQ